MRETHGGIVLSRAVMQEGTLSHAMVLWSKGLEPYMVLWSKGLEPYGARDCSLG